MCWMLGGERCVRRGAAEGNIERGEAYGDGAHRPGRPYEASMGGFLRLIMFVDSASRWMRPYGMKRT